MARSKLRFQLVCVWVLRLMPFIYSCRERIQCLVIMEPGESSGYHAMALLARDPYFLKSCGRALYIYVRDSFDTAKPFLVSIFHRVLADEQWKLGFLPIHIEIVLDVHTPYRILIMGPSTDLALAIEKIGESKLQRVSEIFWAQGYHLEKSNPQDFTSEVDSDPKHSILQFKLLQEKLTRVNIRVEAIGVDRITVGNFPELFVILNTAGVDALSKLRGIRNQHGLNVALHLNNSNKVEEIRFEDKDGFCSLNMKAALAMFNPKLIRLMAMKGTYGDKVISDIHDEQFRILVLERMNKYIENKLA
ncbi:unnamed protein product [Albugo candida]|uniref:Uncharacterized protein n=1 Tax=Albugo candida TaxID=65357 RepID=A0A024FXU1_9STRA|nr:unnamed protein product [Albugo candida]|eukprot:CCI11742.1 unnamed protein product [Albugo candida]